MGSKGLYKSDAHFHPECVMPSTNLKTLSVTELLAMRADIDRLLQSKRTELQNQLAQIGGDGRSVRKAGSVKGTKVAPKYRHPKTGETWSGRGGTAGWLAREIKAGKKREDFLIAKPAKKRGRAKA
jgi:DNA-binding protein H-NS